MKVIELNLTSTTEELEELICSTLSSDISLFEKISSSIHRLCDSSVTKDSDDSYSDIEDTESVDDDSDDSSSGSSSSDDPECDSKNYYERKLYTEIDESHPGEVCLLGLMEGEYSNMSIKEKLNTLVSLIDLLRSSYRIRIEL
ncbi:hypothetical protein PTKIN_Ptkin12aG0115100 [Pterospermum kingtungense]